MSCDEAVLRVLEGVELTGRVNVSTDVILAHVEQSIRRQLPQVWTQPSRPERVCLVGGGPSLAMTLDDLRALVWQGARLVTVNGAYRWCVHQGLKPNAQVVIDARASNARFVDPDVPGCRYYLGSQAHPAIFDAVAGREHVGIFHAVGPEDIEVRARLDAYYLGKWQGVSGGTTVTSRAIGLLRMLGYLRFDLFGIDSCWLSDQHHAFSQPENDQDKKLRVSVHPTGEPEKAREFLVAPWHVQQLQDFLQFIRVSGHGFVLNIHGPGLLAYALTASADVVIEERGSVAHGSTSLVGV